MADKNFIQKATEKMKKKGTIGSFGKATEKKIGAAKKMGGKMEKKAVFAENMKKIAKKHEGETKRSAKKSGTMKMTMLKTGAHKAITGQKGRSC